MNYQESVCRGGQRCPAANLEQGLRCAIEHHPTLPEDTILKRAQIRKQDLVHWWNENQNRSIPSDALMRVVRVTQRFELIELLFADNELGDVLTVVHKVEGDGVDDLKGEVLDVVDATGDAARACRDLRPGRPCDDAALERVEKCLNRIDHRENAEAREVAKRLRRLRQERAGRFPQAVGS
jgi:hypothetical protein